MKAEQLKSDGAKLAGSADKIRALHQEVASSGSVHRAVELCEYFGALAHDDREQVEHFANDAELLKAGDPETLERWSLWFSTIAENASHDD